MPDLEESLRPFRDYTTTEITYAARKFDAQHVVCGVDPTGKIRDSLFLATANRMSGERAQEIAQFLNHARQAGIAFGGHIGERKGYDKGVAFASQRARETERTRIANARAEGYDAGYQRARQELKLSARLYKATGSVGRTIRGVWSYLWISDAE